MIKEFDMKVTGTRSNMKVELDDGKIAIFTGELVLDGFWADKNSVSKWESPYEDIPFTEKDLINIMYLIEEKNKISKLKVWFD